MSVSNIPDREGKWLEQIPLREISNWRPMRCVPRSHPHDKQTNKQTRFKVQHFLGENKLNSSVPNSGNGLAAYLRRIFEKCLRSWLFHLKIASAWFVNKIRHFNLSFTRKLNVFCSNLTRNLIGCIVCSIKFWVVFAVDSELLFHLKKYFVTMSGWKTGKFQLAFFQCC